MLKFFLDKKLSASASLFKNIYSCIKLSIFICYSTSVVAQHNVTFTHITNLDGLSQSTVQTIVKDKYGFMWFGTRDGLNRYDGYSFKIYLPKYLLL